MLKKFISYYKPHKGLFSLDMFVALVATTVEVFFPFLTRTLIRDYIPQKNVDLIINALYIMVGIYLIKLVCTYIRIKWGHILGVRMEYDMRADIFRHLQKLSFNYYDNTKTGHIMSRISNDLSKIAEVAHHAPENLILSILKILGAFLFMFSFNVKLALIALIPLPLMFLWGVFYGGKMRNGFRKVRRKIADINSTVENSIQGIREVKSYANESVELDKFENANSTFKYAKENVYAILGVFHSVFQFLSDFYFVIIIGAGTWLIFNGELGAADLIAFILYINIILKPINRLINFTEQFQRGSAAFERFLEVMKIDPDIEDKTDAYSYDDIKGKIEIKDLYFKYKNTKDMVLKNINIEVKNGEEIAIVGESGAGKSTLISLIPRFYEPDKGKILIDGHDIMNLKKNFLRNNIGIVRQDLFLFDGTIRDNIMYGKPDATEEEMIEAAKNANIFEFISSLENGFDTQVGERGVKLSGGQKQRISIARVFLKNPPMLIFDEATSSLDNESESLIQRSMYELSKNRTTIIIAHRLSTVKHVDKIHVLKNGEIIETGDHETLLEKEGYYYGLYTKNLF
ncbi:MAG: ABC transporter ATP-binding protein [Candidatus Mcinerneyibacterium aminivorans]|uniref:ABC transporter ATP-binding protein n=1 Tax=Candidatus Mcinerneyibacterium aminivorans TaxID=2703815 RepID=A0A5D0MEF8_9BACT|nr:MAG: ABC transporter ATP-binding protein [Candidatus Mcinerneyibacterium aminivorans]